MEMCVLWVLGKGLSCEIHTWLLPVSSKFGNIPLKYSILPFVEKTECVALGLGGGESHQEGSLLAQRAQ